MAYMTQDRSSDSRPHRAGQPLDSRIGRRAVLAGTASISGMALAGCLGGSGGDTPDPVALPDDAACDNCGMIISKHPGPNGQLFYASNDPETHPAPYRYDALKKCFFPDLLEAQQLGWTATAKYVTDYSSVDYTLQQEGETTYISSHLAPESYGHAEDMTYVVGSDLEGAMGPDFYPFSNQEDARTIADEYGGQLVPFDDIDAGLIGK